MPLPSLAATSGNLIRDGIYVEAQIKADPETSALGNVLETPQEVLEKNVAGRRQADKAAIMASAVADFRLNAVQRAIVKFGNQCFGHFTSRTAPGYLLIFPTAPNTVANANPSDRVQAFGDLRKAATSGMTPKELAAPVKVLVTAIDDWTAGVGASAKANDALEQASKAEAAAADDWQTAVRKLRGKLIDLFPRDVKRQRSYLPATKPSKKVKLAVAETKKLEEAE